MFAPSHLHQLRAPKNAQESAAHKWVKLGHINAVPRAEEVEVSGFFSPYGEEHKE